MTVVSEDLPVQTGTLHNLMCSATRNLTFPNSTLLGVTWLDPRNNPIGKQDSNFSIIGDRATNRSSLTSRLTFNYVRASQAGPYTCVVNMFVPKMLTNYTVNSTLIVTVQSKWIRAVQYSYCQGGAVLS